MPLPRRTFLTMTKLKSSQPLSIEDIKKVQSLCRDIDDEMRWLIALISDTGMRLGEAAGLLKEDIKVDEPIPHIVPQTSSVEELKDQRQSKDSFP